MVTRITSFTVVGLIAFLAVPATGQILLRGASTAWEGSTMVSHDTAGVIRVSCFSVWYETGQMHGGHVFREPCKWTPFEPDLPTLPVGL